MPYTVAKCHNQLWKIWDSVYTCSQVSPHAHGKPLKSVAPRPVSPWTYCLLTNPQVSICGTGRIFSDSFFLEKSEKSLISKIWDRLVLALYKSHLIWNCLYFFGIDEKRFFNVIDPTLGNLHYDPYPNLITYLVTLRYVIRYVMTLILTL